MKTSYIGICLPIFSVNHRKSHHFPKSLGFFMFFPPPPQKKTPNSQLLSALPAPRAPRRRPACPTPRRLPMFAPRDASGLEMVSVARRGKKRGGDVVKGYIFYVFFLCFVGVLSLFFFVFNDLSCFFDLLVFGFTRVDEQRWSSPEELFFSISLQVIGRLEFPYFGKRIDQTVPPRPYMFIRKSHASDARQPLVKGGRSQKQLQSK